MGVSDGWVLARSAGSSSAGIREVSFGFCVEQCCTAEVRNLQSGACDVELRATACRYVGRLSLGRQIRFGPRGLLSSNSDSGAVSNSLVGQSSPPTSTRPVCV